MASIMMVEELAELRREADQLRREVEQLRTELRSVIDNVRSGSYESTMQAIDRAETLCRP